MRKAILLLVFAAGCGGDGGGGGGGGSSGGGGGGGGILPSTGFALDESSAPVGAPVTARGSGFGGAPGSVTFGGVPAITMLVWTDTRVSVVVPAGASSGTLVLATASSATFSAPFTVTSGDVWFVAPTGSNTNPGTLASPFQTIQRGVNLAGAGDWVVVRGGTYDEAVTTQAAGVTIAGYPGEAAKIDRLGRCLTVNHASMAVKDLEIESNFGASDAVRTSSASDMVLRRLVIHDAGSATTGAGDGIDIIGGSNMLVEECTIYDCLAGSWSVQTDAHGIVAGGGFTNLTIRRCSIYRCSGDSVQADPGRSPWSGLVIEGCDLWTGPLPSSKAAWVAGQIPGENALDTKTPASPAGAQTFVVRDCTIHGFSSGWIGNQAALNVKEAVSGTIERCTIYDNVLAFRMRGATNGTITVKNCVVYDSTYALRYEDGIPNLRFHNVTFADSATAHFQNGGGGGLGTGFQALNGLFQGSVPAEAAGPSNLAVTTAAWVSAAARDYHLAAGAAAIDAGVTIAGVTDDRDGVARPAGAAYDVGAYERP